MRASLRAQASRPRRYATRRPSVKRRAGSATWPGTFDRRSARRKAELELAQQVGEAPLLGVAERGEDPSLVAQVRLAGGVDEIAAGGRQRDQRAAAVAGVGAARDQSRPLEAVQALGRAARGQHQRAGELRRAQAVRRSGAAQRGEHVVPAGLEPLLAVDGLQAALELAGEPRYAPYDPARRRVEVRALAPPLLEDLVD